MGLISLEFVKRSSMAAGLVSIAALTGAPAMAQSYPEKPIRFVVPTSPGGNADIVARTVAAGMSGDLGQQVFVDNRPGGRQIPGTLFAARSAPDGYTLFAVGLSYTVNAGLYNDLPYDPVEDFAPISSVGSAPLLLVANPKLPANSVKELIALAKAKPGTLNYASAGVGSPAHLAGELLKSMAGINLTHVAYKGTAQGNNDTMSGVVQLALPGTSSVVKLVQTGKLKALGITGPKRSALLPDVPAVAETLPGYEVELWNGIVTMAGTPEPVVNRLNAAMVKALGMPSVKDKLVNLGLDVEPRSPEAFGKYIREQIRTWSEVIKLAGIKSQRSSK